jgi:hypothetical protein
VGTGAGYYFDSKGADYKKNYDAATTPTELLSASSNMNNMATDRNASYGIAAGTALLGLVLWFWPEGGK